MSNDFVLVCSGKTLDDCPPDTIRIVGNADTNKWISDNQWVNEIRIDDDFMPTPEQVEAAQEALAQLSEIFRNFLDAVTQIVDELVKQLKALGLFDIGWDAIDGQAEAFEKAHAKRFKMYRRRYERGKAR